MVVIDRTTTRRMKRLDFVATDEAIAASRPPDHCPCASVQVRNGARFRGASGEGFASEWTCRPDRQRDGDKLRVGDSRCACAYAGHAELHVAGSRGRRLLFSGDQISTVKT